MAFVTISFHLIVIKGSCEDITLAMVINVVYDVMSLLRYGVLWYNFFFYLPRIATSSKKYTNKNDFGQRTSHFFVFTQKSRCAVCVDLYYQLARSDTGKNVLTNSFCIEIATLPS